MFTAMASEIKAKALFAMGMNPGPRKRTNQPKTKTIMKNQTNNGEHDTDRDVKNPFASAPVPNAYVGNIHFTTVQGKARSFKPKNLRAHLVNGILTLGLVAGFASAMSLPTRAADLKPGDSKPADSKPGDLKPTGSAGSKTADPKAAKKESSGRFVPFHGKLDSVDVSGKSIKSGDRTFQVLATTKITKDGVKPGTLEDAKVGESIGGAYWEENGSYQLHSLRLGPKPEKKTATRKR